MKIHPVHPGQDRPHRELLQCWSHGTEPGWQTRRPSIAASRATGARGLQAVPDAGRVLATSSEGGCRPHGQIGVFRASGTVRKDMQLFVGDGRKKADCVRPTSHQLQGRTGVDELPGDIGAIAKVDEIEFDSVLHRLHDEDHIHRCPRIPAADGRLAVERPEEGAMSSACRHHPRKAGHGRPDLFLRRAPPEQQRRQ